MEMFSGLFDFFLQNVHLPIPLSRVRWNEQGITSHSKVLQWFASLEKVDFRSAACQCVCVFAGSGVGPYWLKSSALPGNYTDFDSYFRHWWEFIRLGELTEFTLPVLPLQACKMALLISDARSCLCSSDRYCCRDSGASLTSGIIVSIITTSRESMKSF